MGIIMKTIYILYITINPAGFMHSYHVLHPSGAEKDFPTLYIVFPNLHPQVGQHSLSPAGITTPPGMLLQVGASHSTNFEIEHCITKSTIMQPIIHGNLYYMHATINALIKCIVCMTVCIIVYNIIMLPNTTRLLYNYLQHILEAEMALDTLDSIHLLGPLHLDSPGTTHPKTDAK